MQTTLTRTNDSLRAVVAPRLRRLGWVSILAAMALAGCTATKTEAPELAGPSELGLSLEMRASPDVLTMDGQSVSNIEIKARDESGTPAAGRPLRVEIMSGGQILDIGRLSLKNPTTGSDGIARVVYTAPPGPPSQNSDNFTIITLIATPAGTDYRNALARQLDIRLVPQGVILGPSGSPVAKFTAMPTSPAEDAQVVFDASATIPACEPDPAAPNDVDKCRRLPGTIVSYEWDFDGDGVVDAGGMRASTRYSQAGTYVVTLTVTNDRGYKSQISNSITVTQVAAPTADFVISPTAPAANQNVFFNAAASKASPGRSISDYEWDFGDGTDGSGVIVSHRYTKAGSFVVTLSVTDSAGKTGVVSKSVTVSAGQAPTAN